MSESALTESSTHQQPQTYRNAYWIAAIFIIVCGAYLTHIQFKGIEWLTRSGCLVVLLGIWSGIGGVIEENLAFRRSKWRRRNALTVAKARLAEENAEPQKIAKQLAEIEQAFDDQMFEVAQTMRLSIGALEVSLLMTGTFLWGFGDILL